MDLMTITEAAEYMGVTRQAIHLAIKKKKLKAEKSPDFMWTLSVENLRNYFDNLYVRTNRCKPEEVTAKHAADILKVSLMRIYYLMKIGQIKYEKRKGEIFIQRNSLM